MITCKDYFLSTEVACDPELLDIIKVGREYRIYQGAEALPTPGGNLYSHPSEKFIRSLITDLQLRKSISCGGLSFALLHAFKLDVLDAGTDPFFELLDNHADADPFVRIKTAGSHAGKAFRPEEQLFNFAFITLTGLITEINNYTAGLISELPLEENEDHPFRQLLRYAYSGMDSWEKTVVQVLSDLHAAGVVLPLALASSRITPAGYAKGLIALRIQEPSAYERVYAEACDAGNFLDSLREHDGNQRSLQFLIIEGEGDSIEFKSTLRWDIRAGKTNQAIERACLKTISAFLNSRGGALLIGVRDDGSIEGIETDKFPNEDKFLLHLWTLIRTCLGRDFSPYIRTVLEKVDEKSVCIVHCEPSARPVFLRQPGFDEEMFIRVGPSSNALDISEALQYIRERFSEGGQ